MYSHPIIVEMMARERQAMLLNAARKSHLIHYIKSRGARKPSWHARFMTNVAEFLIFLGLKLKEKSASGACAAVCTSGSSCNNGLGA